MSPGRGAAVKPRTARETQTLRGNPAQGLGPIAEHIEQPLPVQLASPEARLLRPRGHGSRLQGCCIDIRQAWVEIVGQTRNLTVIKPCRRERQAGQFRINARQRSPDPTSKPSSIWMIRLACDPGQQRAVTMVKNEVKAKANGKLLKELSYAGMPQRNNRAKLAHPAAKPVFRITPGAPGKARRNLELLHDTLPERRGRNQGIARSLRNGRLRAHGFIGIREHGQQPFILAQLTRESACSGPHRSMARAQRSLKMPPKPFPLIVKAKP
ncbi:hypothetical protein ZRA01_37340 [Zoogloea ramigera]|uniref:Uncharacterized protein n=1 Tax=Zoogloea ramigera TaxID=350 RepID=A0A4Y4CXL5_ZOORA|nr:hypothetical protein ZRA01_37340 [Zoogloea ramigera]